jgi:hypothetical protein
MTTTTPQVRRDHVADPARIYIAIGQNAWGRAFTPREAMKKCRSQIPSYVKNRKIVVVDCPKGAWVNGIDGAIMYERGSTPAFEVKVV